MKRLLFSLLAAMLLIGLLPLAAWADEPPTNECGTGATPCHFIGNGEAPDYGGVMYVVDSASDPTVYADVQNYVNNWDTNYYGHDYEVPYMYFVAAQGAGCNWYGTYYADACSTTSSITCAGISAQGCTWVSLANDPSDKGLVGNVQSLSEIYAGSDFNDQQVICHELGLALGLSEETSNYNPGSCMDNPETGYTNYNNFDANELFTDYTTAN